MYYIRSIENYDDGTCNLTLYGRNYSFYSDMIKLKDKDKLNKEMKTLIMQRGIDNLDKAKKLEKLLKKDLSLCEISIEEL